MRLFTFLLLLCFSVLMAVPYGLYVMPDMNLALGLGLAVLMGVIIAVAVRIIFIALLGSLITAFALLLLITVTSQYFFFAVERDRWFGNQDELPQFVPVAERESAYMAAIGLDQSSNPIADWFNHSHYQAQSALASRQLKPNQVGTPRLERSTDDILIGWLTQFIALLCSLFGGAVIARRKS